VADQPPGSYYDELSDLLFKAGKITAAMNLMESSLRLEALPRGASAAKDGAWWFRRGMEYADACLYEESCACLNRAIAAGSDNFETHYCLAGLYKSLERFDKPRPIAVKPWRTIRAFPIVHPAGFAQPLGRPARGQCRRGPHGRTARPGLCARYYDLACYYSLAGRGDKALAAFETALAKGFCDFDWAGRDPDLEKLRVRPEFRDLLDSYASRK